MYSKIKWLIALALALAIGVPATSFGIVRVSKSYNYLQFYGGYAQAVGKYDHINEWNFFDENRRIVELNADKVYDPTYSFAVSYGQVRGRLGLDFGFHYTRVKTPDTFFVSQNYFNLLTPETPRFDLYDADLNVNLFLMDPWESIVAPYLGVGFHGGLISATGRIIDTKSDLVFGMGINFGADLKIWTAPSDAAYMTISSVNEYQILGSELRPRYLNIGGAIKYYFRY